jgi:hypothetical protein
MSENTKEKAAKQLPQPVRWTVQAGAMDFAIDEKTLAARLNRAGTLPGRDKRYSTAQIAAAVYGDLRQNQTRDFGAALEPLASLPVVQGNDQQAHALASLAPFD